MAKTLLRSIPQPAGVPTTKADIAEGLSLVTFHPPVRILAFLTTYSSAFWLPSLPITSLMDKRKTLIQGQGQGWLAKAHLSFSRSVLFWLFTKLHHSTWGPYLKGLINVRVQ